MNTKLTQLLESAEKDTEAVILTGVHMLTEEGKQNVPDWTFIDEITKHKMKNTLEKVKGRKKD